MGFDIDGINATTEKGKYFRNNIWWWPRLWSFCCDITSEITLDERRRGFHNDGLEIFGEKHAAMVRNLEMALKDKPKFAEWIKDSELAYSEKGHPLGAIIEAIVGSKKGVTVEPSKCEYPFSWENVEEFLEFLKGNKGFAIY